MKNILKHKTLMFFITFLAIIFCNFTGANAQDRPQPPKEEPPMSYEAIQMQKIAFYTAELDLTPQEAEKFWPLYNEFWDARGKARREVMDALRKLNDNLEAESAITDTEIRKLSEIYLANYTAEAELMSEYFVKFQKILPIKKAAKIFSTEEKFRRMLIKQLRHAPHKDGK